MTQFALSIETTIQDSKSKLKSHSLKDSQGSDITESFLNYCKKKQLPVGSQEQIEHAAIEFSKSHPNSL